MNLKYIKLAILSLLFFSSISVMAQKNIFRAGNVIITSPSTITYGKLADINDGNLVTDVELSKDAASSVELTMELVQPEVLKEYLVNYFYSSQNATTVILSGSQNKATWTQIDSRAFSPSASNISATVTNTVSYKYYRLLFTGIERTTLDVKELVGTTGQVSAPTLTVTAGSVSNLATLTWSQEITVAGTYEIERSGVGNTFSLIQTTNNTTLTYNETALARNTQYFYRVRVNKGNGVFGPYSEIKGLLTASDVLTNKPSLTVTRSATLGSIVTLNWSLGIEGPGSFDIERSANGTDFTLLTNVDKAIVTYTDAALTQNTDYWYRVRGKNEVSTSPYSDIVKITTISDALTAAPVLSVSTYTGSQANLSWTYGAFNTIGGFEMERSTDGIEFVSIGKVDKSVKSYTNESLSLNTDYWYRVRAYNYVGNSPYSTVVKIKTNNLTGVGADITDDGGTLTASADNSGGANADEGSKSLIDNNIARKWLVFKAQASGALSATYQPTGSYILTGYSLTTANDAAPRDPKDWTFSGSDNNSTWTTLDTRTNQLGNNVERLTTVSYQFTTPVTKAYKYYRINFTNNNGSTDIVRYQVAEWQIFGLDSNSPDIPSKLTVTGTTLNSINLSWEQGLTKPVKQFELQRSVDGMNYERIAEIVNTTTTYTDANLYDGATYYYRIRAIGEKVTAISGFSNVATGKTLATAGVPLSPAYLTATEIKNTSISLKWADRSDDETSFSLERSKDNITFEQIKSLPSNTSTYVDATVWAGSYFYYRISAIKDKIKSAYSNTFTVLTTGTNTAPQGPFKDPLLIAPQNICGGAGEYNLSINGITAGPGYEKTQKMKVTSVKANDDASAKFFSAFSFDPELADTAVFNGIPTQGKIANFKVVSTGIALPGDSAFVKVTIKDDGGTIGFASDSTEFVVKVYFTDLKINIVSDKGLSNISRYAAVNLTAKTNYPENTAFKWNEAPGIIGSRDGIKLLVSPIKETTYSLVATTPQGCTATASITIAPQDSLVVSTVLTPNGDGKNDTWQIWGIEKIPTNTVRVTDRQGRLVFTKQNYQNDWDGTFNGSILPQGGYYYIVETNDGKDPRKGVLTIVKQ